MKIRLCFVAALAVASAVAETADRNYTSLASPDGRNEIRFRTDPLSYCVARDGVEVTGWGKIGFSADGTSHPSEGERAVLREVTKRTGTIKTPVYKKARVDESANEQLVDFGSWGVRFIARDDGVAYRLEIRRACAVEAEKADVELLRDSLCRYHVTRRRGLEETIPSVSVAGALPKGPGWVYPPFLYTVGGKTVVVAESDVRRYPTMNYRVETRRDGTAVLSADMARWPKDTVHVEGRRRSQTGGRWIRVLSEQPYLVRTEGPAELPWRVFVLADAPSKVCESDIVYALAKGADPKLDFSWVRPGKVPWDIWCKWRLDGVSFKTGCNTKTYEYFIDFAARNKLEYVIFDEGWSVRLDIWRNSPAVDVPHLVKYAKERGVGIILWMAWAQVFGCEEKVAEHFARLGVAGFKIDYMDRADGEVQGFYETFAAACARHGLVVDYHGVTHPAGLPRTYPNVLNYEGVYGLEQGVAKNPFGHIGSEVAVFYTRQTAGPMDYTPGAMLNIPLGRSRRERRPCSVGTRARQVAMYVLYEAPLQMLCDSPTDYESAANKSSLAFIAATPTTWDETVGLPGTPETFAACARRKGGTWYAAAIAGREGGEYALDTSFLGEGEWTAHVFRDAPDGAVNPQHTVEERRTIRAGEAMTIHVAPGGGFSIRFVRQG